MTETVQSIDRLPPHSFETEKAFIGCLMADPNATVPDALSAGANRDWFYDIRNAELFSIIIGMVEAGLPVDLVTVSEEVRKRGKLGAVDFDYIMAAADMVPSAANLPYYAAILKEMALTRAALRIFGAITSELLEPGAAVDGLIERAESEILRLRHSPTTREARTMRELVISVTHVLEQRCKGINDGLETGFYDIDIATNGGMRGGEMWVVAARPNMGKTAWVMNTAVRIGERWKGTGKTILVFSLEMTGEQIVERIVASKAKINTRKPLTEHDHEPLSRACIATCPLPILIDDTSPMPIAALRARARRHYSKNNVGLIIVDYLQLISSETGAKETDRRVQVDGISRGLKSLAKELNIPLLVVAQINREFEKDKTRVPRMSDLRESGQIEQDADLIAFIYSKGDGPEDPLAPRTLQWRIAKQRNGPKNFDVPLTFMPHLVQFESQSK